MGDNIKHTIKSIKKEYVDRYGKHISTDVAKLLLAGRLRFDGVDEVTITKIIKKGE